MTTSHRIERVNELIKAELGTLIRREIEIPLGTLATISRVNTATDLATAEVWVSVFPVKLQGTVLKLLSRHAGLLQSFLNRRLEMQWVPRIHFRIDTSAERADGINRLLDDAANRTD